MKSILYVVAIVLSCAAGYFSYSNVGKQQDQLDQTKAQKDLNANLQSSIQEAKKKTKEEQGLLTQAQDLNSELIAKHESSTSEVGNTNTRLKKVQGEVASLEEELAEIEAAKKAAQAIFGDEIRLEDVPAKVEELDNERKQLSKNFEELEAASEILTGQVNKNRESMSELERRAESRTASLRGNAAASLITSVNNSWGFVVIKPHSNASISEESKLIIVRGSRHVGRLKINSIEPNRIIADIDYESLAPGVRVQAGDKVILAEANTR